MTPTRQPSKLWTHFIKRDDFPFMAICKHCNNSFSYRTSTGNLNSHIKRSHTAIYVNSMKNISMDDGCSPAAAQSAQVPKPFYFQSNSTTINAAIIENPTPSNASPSNYTPSTTSDSILPTPEEQDLPGHSSYDEYQIFGDYVANEIRNMNYLKYKGELKRKIQKLIIEYTEKDENEYLAHTNFESPAETVSFIEVPTSKATSSEVPSTSQDLFMESKPFVPKLEIIDDPLPEIE